MLKKTILALCISAPFLVAGCDDATKENVSKKAADIKEAAQTQLSDVKDAAEEVKMQAAGKVAGKRKLTAVCSHQTRIGNLDAHLI
ncbi:hypothetical protein [Escherichia coli]